MDARVPVVFGAADQAPPDAALLIEGDAPGPPGVAAARFRASVPLGHAAGCACCMPRGPVSEALAGLFQARARGEVPFFRNVVAVMSSPEGEAAIRAALASDILTMARFRLGG